MIDSADASRYWAFISYSYVDRAWADWLHHALESYRIPRHLVGTVTEAGKVPARLSPVFLDRLELAASGSLDATIAAALGASRTLIVICSPAAVASPRVEQEIATFRRLTSGRVLSLIVSGRPDARERGAQVTDECFPASLRHTSNASESKGGAPLAADARPGKNHRQDALLKLIAGVLNVDLDQLQQRDLQRRRRRWAVVATSCLVGMLCASTLAIYAWRQRDRAIQVQAQLLVQTAAARMRMGDAPGAQAIVLEVMRNRELMPIKTDAAINVFQEANAADKELLALTGHGNIVRFAAFSPDGSRIVTASDDHTARIWDAALGRELVRLSGHGSSVYSAVFSPDGRRIVTASMDDTARVWDAASGHEILQLRGHESDVRFAAFSPDGRRIVTASFDRTSNVWDAATGRQLLRLRGHADRVLFADFSADGKRIVTASYDHTARIWNAATGRQLALLQGHTLAVCTAMFSPDGQRIVTASRDKTVRVWDAATGRQLMLISGHTNEVWSAAFSPDGRYIVTASLDKTVGIWELQTGKPLAVLGQSDLVSSARFSPDGTRIVVTFFDHTARILDIDPAQQLAVLRGHDDGVTCVVFSRDGKRILTASNDSTARIWDAATQQQLTVLRGHQGTVNMAVFSPDGGRIATASSDRTARVWDAMTGRQLVGFADHQAAVFSVGFSPDGREVVSASADKTVRIWDAVTGQQLKVFSGDTQGVESAQFSPDGNRIVTASDDGMVRVLDAVTGRQVMQSGDEMSRASSASFSADGRRIVATVEEKAIRILDSSTGQPLQWLRGPAAIRNEAAFSPDARRVVSTWDDDSIRIWDVATGYQLAAFGTFSSGVLAAVYSPDGQRIASASQHDKSARIWSAVVADLDTQIQWTRAAQFDPLLPERRAELGLPVSPDVRQWGKSSSQCDQTAAAFYDPDRRARGVTTEQLVPNIAAAACSTGARHARDARALYQHGRALAAGGDLRGAKGDFEAAIAGGYRAARADLAKLLVLQSSPSMTDISQALALLQRAWNDGVSISAWGLGWIYEHGIKSSDGRYLLAPDLTVATQWYRRGAQAHEPTALAWFGSQADTAAFLEHDEGKRNALLLDAFKYYAAAADSARRQDWPNEAWRDWRFRRASLARLLARAGLMQQVADAYTDATRLH